MAKNVRAYKYWKQMKPAALRRLALAVFLLFGMMGPLSALMESSLHLLSWRFVIVQTIACGGMAANIVLLARKRWWLVILIVAFWSGVIVLNSGAIGFVVDQRGLRVQLSGPDSDPKSGRPKTDVVLQPAELDAIYTQRSIIGALSIVLLVTGYGLFIRVIGRELKERTRLETEVNIARDIQQSLLPKTSVTTAWYSVSGVTVAATEVAGDFFDVVELGESRLAVAIADVAGHGIGAGILSAMTKSALRSQLLHSASPVDVLENLNATVYEVSTEKTFVTLAYLLVDRVTHSLNLATAGHPPVFFKISAKRDVEDLRTVGLGLGMRPSASYASLQRQFQAGDTVFLYTDGILETMNPSQEQFGAERLRRILLSSDLTPDQYCRRVMDEIENFSGSKRFSDDVSFVCVRFT